MSDTTQTIGILMLTVTAVVSAPAWAEADGKDLHKASSADAKPDTNGFAVGPELLARLYIPPAPARPTPLIRTTAGATRSEGSKDLPHVTLLVPEHVALTTQAQPTLYWHLSAPSERPVVVTVVDPDAAQPLAEVTLQPPVRAGTHGFKLSNPGVRLMFEKTYEWSVRVVESAGLDFSGDPFAKAFIERVRPSARLSTRFGNVDAVARAHSYAADGIWYDALEAVSGKMFVQGKESKARQIHARLLEDIGLAFLVNSRRTARAFE